jgi:hypothetical protein
VLPAAGAAGRPAISSVFKFQLNIRLVDVLCGHHGFFDILSILGIAPKKFGLKPGVTA